MMLVMNIWMVMMVMAMMVVMMVMNSGMVQ